MMDPMIIIIAVLSFAVVVLAAFLVNETIQVRADLVYIEHLIDEGLEKDKLIAQHEQTVGMLMLRELSGTWLPAYGAEDPDQPRDNG
jgi:hypothetical protein